MLTSTSLCPIPFLGHCDNVRLQMSAKQLSQAVTNPRCEVPKVIGQEFRYLSDSTKLFKYTAPLDGIITYVNDDIMIVYLKHENTLLPMDILEIPPVISCTGLYASRLRYRREPGPFKAGDLIYEYDCFKQSIPTYGYNLMSAYMSFFGLNHEDAIVISEYAAETCCSSKIEQVLIPIYTYSLFKNIYPTEDSFGFIPAVGQKIQDTNVALKSVLKTYKRKPLAVLKSMNITDFTKVINNDAKFDTIPISSRIANGTVLSIRIHRIDTEQRKLVDRKLEMNIQRLIDNYQIYLRSIASHLKLAELTDVERKEILVRQYYNTRKPEKAGYDLGELIYLIEMQISGESQSHVGDKFANRFANKGVVSLILPNELRPIAMESNRPIDSIIGPISVISRMNFGQILEGELAKAITKAEQLIKQNPTSAPEILLKIAKLAYRLGDNEYGDKINQFSHQMRQDSSLYKQFLHSVEDLGLYFEAPNFANFDLGELSKDIEQEFDVRATEPVKIPRKTIEFMSDRLKIKMPLPKGDIILPNIFTAPIYTIKLKQEASYRSTARDFGHYKATNRQPTQGRSKDGIIGQGSRLGQMELN